MSAPSDFTTDERRWIDAVVEVSGAGEDVRIQVNGSGEVCVTGGFGTVRRPFPLDRAVGIFAWLAAILRTMQKERRAITAEDVARWER